MAVKQVEETAEVPNSLKRERGKTTTRLLTHLLRLTRLCLLQVKVTQELKNTHADQLTRLHFKHQCECDLLEDMRYEKTSAIRAHGKRGGLAREEWRSAGTDFQMMRKMC